MLIRVSMIARLVGLFGIWLVTSGTVAFCSFQSGPGAGLNPGGPGGPDSFRTTLVLRDVNNVVTDNFVFGEPIRFDVTIENLTNREISVQFRDAQTYDFLVADNGTLQIRWQWADDRVFAQVATEVVFAPNTSKTYTALWSGVLADGRHLPPGNYQARGVMLFTGYETNPLAPSEFGSPLEPFRVR
ncbi:MAG TPA: BsuPI-related putative proteinase inhibitor [Steroidobacteraceae bacterium]|nr:BsuPI-related putative proteinase inhibitor [Steroidobacteraceae bacterium]